MLLSDKFFIKLENFTLQILDKFVIYYIINGKENKTSPKQNNVWIILCFIIGIIAIIGTSILMIINKGKNSPLSTINFSYEFVLMIIGLLMVFLAVFYFFKRKK